MAMGSESESPHDCLRKTLYMCYDHLCVCMCVSVSLMEHAGKLCVAPALIPTHVLLRLMNGSQLHESTFILCILCARVMQRYHTCLLFCC